MGFNSLGFLIFYPVVLALYFILPKKLNWIFLLGASWFFYMSWNPRLIVLILFTTVVSYISGIMMAHTDKKGSKRFWLLASIIVCLGSLFIFKYLGFFTSSIYSLAALFNSSAPVPVFNLILPVGISFYTFQTLSYTVDVYRGSIPAEKHFGYYALFVSFFPQLVAGPIERPENLIPQLKEKHSPVFDNFVGGGRKMLIGFFKKIVVADLCAIYVNSVYNAPGEATGLSIVIATVLFAFQIYGDFSGYTDIAIGCAEIMGIKLMKNFDRPYTAVSVKDFWNRWHISLSSWFRDYIYFPLGGSRCSKLRRCFNLFVVFFVSGMWHGAAWTYIIWGLIHAFYRITEELLRKPTDKLVEKLNKNKVTAVACRVFRVGFTFVLVTFAWLFFRANSIGELGVLLSKLFTDWGVGGLEAQLKPLSMTAGGAVVTLLSIIAMNMMDRSGFAARRSEATQVLAVVRYSLVFFAIVFAWVLLWAGNGTSSFIYFQF